MHTPVTAMVWELWGLTRRGLGLKLSILVLVGGSALTVAGLYGQRDAAATMVLLILGMMGVMSAAQFKSMDSRPGFPLYLGYSRPVPTWLLAGVPMIYLGVSSAISYLGPAVVLRTAFSVPFPLAPAALSVTVGALVIGASQWWTHNTTAQALGKVAFFACVFLTYRSLHPINIPGNDFPPERWAVMFDFSARAYGLIALAGLFAIAVAIAGIERQRRGEDSFALWSGGGSAGRATALGRFVNLPGVPCPTSSPTRAQLWLEMKRVGVPVLVVGVMTALAIPLLFSLWSAYRLELALLGSLFSPAAPVLAGIGSMPGFRRRQGVADLSGFDATRALGTARLVGVKLLVTVACIVIAWGVIAASFWVSLALEPWGGRARAGISEFLGALSDGRLAALATIIVVQLAAVVACAAAVQHLFVLHARRVTVAALAVGLYGLALVISVAGGWVAASVVTASAWIGAVVLLAGTLYVFRRALAERILTPSHAGAALLAWTGFVTVGLTLIPDAQLARTDLSTALTVLAAASSLVPLAAVALAPWSLSLIRHR